MLRTIGIGIVVAFTVVGVACTAVTLAVYRIIQDDD
jgi:hypothetical protein